jgi:membrane protease YdiL (CAAX protease family)
MNTATQFLKRHSLVIGIILMFLYTWSIDLSNAGILPFQVPFPIYITLGWGFILASLIMTGLTLGKEAVVTLLRRYVQWRVGWKWFLAALLLEPIFIVVGVYLDAVLTRVPPDFSNAIAYELFGKSASLPLFFLPFFLVEIITNGEEMGWRGYILPRLQAKYNALTSTLILGVIWGFWHLPKFLSHFDAVAFAWFMLHIMAFAVILTWLYNNTKGSLLMVAICHAISNTVSIFVPMASTVSSENMGSYIIYVLLEAAAAVVIIFVSGPARLSRTEEKQMQPE